MKVVHFEDQNIVINEGQENELPAYFDKLNRTVVTCHELTPEEIKTIIETGKVWVQRVCVGTPPMMPIVVLTTDKPLREMTVAEKRQVDRMEKPTRQQVRRQAREGSKILKAVK